MVTILKCKKEGGNAGSKAKKKDAQEAEESKAWGGKKWKAYSGTIHLLSRRTATVLRYIKYQKRRRALWVKKAPRSGEIYLGNSFMRKKTWGSGRSINGNSSEGEIITVRGEEILRTQLIKGEKRKRWGNM